MLCSAVIASACQHRQLAGVAGGVTGVIANGALAAIAGAVRSAIAWVFSGTADWWVQIPSPDLAAEPAVGALQHWLLPVTAGIATMSMLIAGGKMALTRRAGPLMDVGSGLALVAVTSAVGVLLPSLLLRAGDEWSSWILNASTGGQFASRLTQDLSLSGATPGVVIILGSIAVIMGLIQAVLMFFRQAALVVLAGLLPLAAAGAMTSGMRPGFRRVTGWMLALIFYKPAAAAVYATAFTLIGTGRDVRTQLAGFAMILLALVALPALMKFFTWSTGSIDPPSAGGGVLSTMLSGAVAIGAVRGSAGGTGGTSAPDQARLTSTQLGPQDSPRGQAADGTAWAGRMAGGSAASSESGAAGAASAPAGAAAAASAAGPVGAAAAQAAGATAGKAASAAKAAAEAAQPPAGSDQ